MNSLAQVRRGSNPFGTRFVKPGAMPFEFPAGESTDKLAARLATGGWRGAIVGPHGSGKSTLLLALLEKLQFQGHRIAHYQLHDGERSLHPPAARAAARNQASLVAVDGYEQLGLLARWQLDRLCRQSDIGLLVTSHQSTNVPTLYRTQPTVELALQLSSRLLGGEVPAAWRDSAERVFAERRGDIREVLFALYDLYELQRRV